MKRRSSSEVEDLRRELGARRSRRGRIAAALRERALVYARRRAAEGIHVVDIAGELGLHERTVVRWLAAASTTARALVPVRVVDARPPATTSGATVTMPNGLRIEGLDVDTLCTLVARCG